MNDLRTLMRHVEDVLVKDPDAQIEIRFLHREHSKVTPGASAFYTDGAETIHFSRVADVLEELRDVAALDRVARSYFGGKT